MTTADPVEDDGRPFWSVMIPTYNSDGLLERALRSVLEQDPGPGRMEIVVVDDCSPSGCAEETVARLAPGRVTFRRQTRNLGLAGNWNDCLARARGRWIHLFHQDDLILPGFYERLARADREAPEAGAAFCQHAYITASDRWIAISHLERETPGVLDDWLGEISRRQPVQFASIVVRRDVYEAVGGYRSDLKFLLDWEMWARIALHYPFWFEPTVLACHRLHPGNETSRLRAAGEIGPDVERAIAVVRNQLPGRYHDSVGVMIRRDFVGADGAPRGLRAIARDFVPPALWKAASRLRRAARPSTGRAGHAPESKPR